MTCRFWSLKHKSDVMQWAHGAWRLLTSSSKIRLWCKKTSKCVRCQINSFLKDTCTRLREQMPLIDDSSGFWKYDTPRVCLFYCIIACYSCFFFVSLNWQVIIILTLHTIKYTKKFFFLSEKTLVVLMFARNSSHSCTSQCATERIAGGGSITRPPY